MKAKKAMKLQHMSEVIEAHSKQSSFFLLERIRNIWKQYAGERLSQHGYPIFIKNKVLRVCVDNSAWITQFNFLKDIIIEGLNKGLNDRVIDKLVFVVEQGRRKTAEYPKEETQEENSYDISKITLTKEEIISAKNSVKHIEDLELKTQFYVVIINDFKRFKWLKQNGLETCNLCDNHTFNTNRVCDECEEKARKAERIKWLKFIKNSPAVTFFEMKKNFKKLTLTEYNTTKRVILDEWKKTILLTKEKKDIAFMQLLIKYYMLMLGTENRNTLLEHIKRFKEEHTVHGGKK